MKAETVDKTLSYMQRSAEEISENFYRQYNIFTGMSSIDEFRNLVMTTFDGLESSDYYKMLNLQRKLNQMCILNDYIIDIMFFFNAENKFVVSPLYVMHGFKMSYEKGLFTCTDFSFDEFVSIIKNNANNYVGIINFTHAYEFSSLFPSETKTPQGKMILFVYKFKLPYAKYDVYAIMFLDINSLKEKLIADRNGFLAIINNGEKILLDASIPDKVLDIKNSVYYDNEKKLTYIKAFSNKNQLSYYTVLSDNDIIGQISDFTALLNILLIVFISLCVALMILSVFYFAKPIQNIFNRLYNNQEDLSCIHGDVIKQIYYKIDVISRDNLLINSKLSNWEPVLKTNLLGRLLKGEFLKNEEKSIIVSLFGADKKENSWQVAVIGMVGKSAYDDSIKTTEVNDIIWRYIPDAIIYMVKSTYFAILAKIESDEDNKSSIETQLEKKCRFILNELNQRYNQLYAISIGNRYTDIFDVHYSFNEAERAFREAYLWRENNAKNEKMEKSMY